MNRPAVVIPIVIIVNSCLWGLAMLMASRALSGTDGYADGEQRRDFLHVDDAVAAARWLTDRPGVRGIFNVGTGHARAFNDVARAVIAGHGSGEIEYIDDGRQGKFRVQLFGRINETEAVKPRFKTRVSEMEKWEKRFLPSRNLGMVILSTPKGVMDHVQAKEENVGGVVLAYVY